MKLFYETRDGDFFVGDSYNAPFPAHVHNVIEVLYIMSGSCELMIAQKTWKLEKGDTAAVFPTVPHAYISFSPDAHGLAAFFSPYTISEFSGIFTATRPITPVLTAHEAGRELSEIAEKLYEISRSGDHTLLRAYLHLFLAHVLPNLELQPTAPEYKECVDKVIGYVSEHFSSAITLKSVSSALGMSASHLSHIFSEQLNIGFRQYVNMLRIDCAKRLLLDPAVSVTEACYKCGYENPRTFNRAFIAECGVTPSRYRAEVQK
ncbi:MAG: AraC family transcriptional regulator [Eubacteriales bacterium]|nr:AraC family transcriptional regulator [Eubacteriales bacterium]MDD3881300.1 AraC family transcriptional regulator [Eubacteriales bacterium]MDD4512218.1 AraC family transcriptional regulator [Eubacteriales bacterium]